MKRPDKKALKILKKYGDEIDSIPKEEFEYARSAGIMFDTIKITHDECIREIFNAENISSKDNYIDLFLASLSTNYLDWRCGLPVYAIIQTFPKHKFVQENFNTLSHNPPCSICSNFKETKENFSFANQIRFECGGLFSHTLKHYAFYLKEHNKLDAVKPNEKDLNIFSSILDIIVNAKENDKMKKEVESKIGKINNFKSNKEQRKVFLETLGYCGILETEEHKGAFTQFTNLGNAPRTNINSDWEYPVDFWLGKYGINKEAFKFWFGNYYELEKFWK